MKTAKIIKGDLIGRSNLNEPQVLFRQWCLVKDEDVEKSLEKKIKDFFKSKMRFSSIYRVSKERNVDIKNFNVCLMPSRVNFNSKMEEKVYSIIKKKVERRKWKNTLFVFRNSDSSVLLEVWPGSTLAKTVVYVYSGEPGFFHFNHYGQEMAKSLSCLDLKDYFTICSFFFSKELDEIIFLFFLDNDKDWLYM